MAVFNMWNTKIACQGLNLKQQFFAEGGAQKSSNSGVCNLDGDGDRVASSFASIWILNEKPHLLCQLLHSVAVNVGEEQLHLAAEKVASDVSEAR